MIKYDHSGLKSQEVHNICFKEVGELKIMMSIKQAMKKSKYTKRIINCYSKIKTDNKKNKRLKYHGRFINRSRDQKYLCIVLIGYKPYLYPYVIPRLKKTLLENMDICLITSGLYSDEIANICEENRWSYLSTIENHVGLVQNVAIHLHPSAEYIFKLDEDIFITKDYFENMLKVYNHAKAGKYNPGVIAPLLNINAYGYERILTKLGLVEEFTKRFGPIKIAASKNSREIVAVEGSVEIARFMWGDGNIIPSIDLINEKFSQEELIEKPCPIRFSIGAILFARELWQDMGYFRVDLSKNSMGDDEIQICTYCCIKSKPIMVSENIVVGHFSFGKQTEGMKEYLLNHSDKFEVFNERL